MIFCAKRLVNSLVNVDFWTRRFGDEFWKGLLPDGWAAEKERFGDSETIRAAVHWRNIQVLTEDEVSAASPGQVLNIRYEDFVRNPGESLNSIIKFCDLPESSRINEWIAVPNRYRSMDDKFLRAFSRSEIADMESVMQPWLVKRGYVPLPRPDSSR